MLQQQLIRSDIVIRWWLIAGVYIHVRHLASVTVHPSSHSCDVFPQVSVVGDTVNVSGQSNCTPVKVPECRLSEDLGQLFQSSSFSDVFLSVGGHEFRVHKSILAGRCSFLFEWML